MSINQYGRTSCDATIGTRQDGSPFAIPVDAFASRIVLLGKSGSGKTNTGAVLIEKAYAGGVVPIVLDPLGNMHGLRSSADGESAGIPIAIFGGAHGDAPLPLHSAEYLATYLAEGVPSVLDLSEMPTEDQTEFADTFLPKLLQQAALHRRNLFVVLEEADRFARNTGKTTPVTMFARAARNAGIGWMYSTHKPAVVHKEILDTANLFVAMKMTGELAQEALSGEIGSRIGVKAARRMIADFASFAQGEAWFIPDGDWLGDGREWEPERIRFKKRDTFHVQPPRVGAERFEPKVLAAVDIAALREALTIAPTADAGDVDALRARIRDLEEQLANAPEPVVTTERVEVPVLDKDDVDRLSTTLESASAFGKELVRIAERMQAALDAAALREPAAPVPNVTASSQPSEEWILTALRPPNNATRSAVGVALGKGPLGLIEVLVGRYPMKVTRAQLATLAGRSIKSSSFAPHISELDAAGLLERHGPLLTASAAALDRFAGGVKRSRSSPAEVLAMWRQALKTPGLVAMLDAAARAYPQALSLADWATAAGVSPTSSAVTANARILRDNGLVERLSDGTHRASTLIAKESK